MQQTLLISRAAALYAPCRAAAYHIQQQPSHAYYQLPGTDFDYSAILAHRAKL